MNIGHPTITIRSVNEMLTLRVIIVEVGMRNTSLIPSYNQDDSSINQINMPLFRLCSSQTGPIAILQ